jgi:hypothetical protein
MFVGVVYVAIKSKNPRGCGLSTVEYNFTDNQWCGYH